MPVEHKIETSYKTKEGTGKKTVTIVQGDVGVHAEVSIPAGQTVQINLTLDVSEIKGLNIGCSKGDCTVKTNSSSSPADTLEIDNKQDIIWIPSDPRACPLTTDVTALYVTNNGDESSDFYLQAAVDSTPGVP